MVEKNIKYQLEDKSVVERLVDFKDVSIAHAILESGEKFPAHNSNAKVQIIIVKGELSIKLEEQEVHKYQKGSILEVPFDTFMELSNEGNESMEFFAIKAPSPTYKG